MKTATETKETLTAPGSQRLSSCSSLHPRMKWWTDCCDQLFSAFKSPQLWVAQQCRSSTPPPTSCRGQHTHACKAEISVPSEVANRWTKTHPRFATLCLKPVFRQVGTAVVEARGWRWWWKTLLAGLCRPWKSCWWLLFSRWLYAESIWPHVGPAEWCCPSLVVLDVCQQQSGGQSEKRSGRGSLAVCSLWSYRRCLYLCLASLRPLLRLCLACLSARRSTRL